MDLLFANAPVAVCFVLVLASFYVLNFVLGKNSKPFLAQNDRNTKVHVPLIFRENLSHDTVRFRFGLPNSACLGLPIGACIKFYCQNVTGVKAGEWNGREDPEHELDEIERKYTPVTSDQDKGFFEVIIKVYSGGVLPQFPDGGKMSQTMNRLKIGDQMTISGPWGPIEYPKPSTFVYMKKEMKKTQIGMIAGGSGITPMLQVVNAVLSNPNDKSQLSLIYANKTEDDILVKTELDELAMKYPKQFHLHYTLDNPVSADWPGSKGFVSQEMIETHLPPPSDDTVILMCGPPPMIKFACKANLDKLGFSKSDQLAF
mmetsp:Transcript_26341/g.34256  ORF Transcript_26341/g.34256 Transcript_26341/m.34256 type:complete len:315 (+) Transcript_26341:102-1046(+)|eukprot:CAMPEP_0114358988 /NCGR_PEP_ID=MMETSP0101-20121206/22679_1 /TAXON_ID=38822 ORGANISM="Pteridomonas danica, Strain PT" /NCGR_SAMPLE_ID=MMETSP0101 /ASSEMBLY_ACC=CAM_ASM_000211 /LENGTH=314 /DNA_ID=CAMNT_0001502305 /DNA_START=33 /DNA_END=977 /DNA_ORIENTATION=+